MSELTSKAINKSEGLYQDAFLQIYRYFDSVSFSKKDPERPKKFVQKLDEAVHIYFESTQIPEDFVEKNISSIIFVPTDDSEVSPYGQFGKDEDSPEKAKLRELFYNEGIHKLKILNLQNVQEVLNFCESKLNKENKEIIGRIYLQSALAYIENLDLYNLTKDEKTTIYRSRISENEEDIEFNERRKYGDVITFADEFTVNGVVAAISQYRVVTYWFRKEFKENTYTTRSIVEHSTIGQAKKDHYIALDPGAPSALILINKN